jgi:hypothetical protein
MITFVADPLLGQTPVRPFVFPAGKRHLNKGNRVALVIEESMILP